ATPPLRSISRFCDCAPRVPCSILRASSRHGCTALGADSAHVAVKVVAVGWALPSMLMLVRERAPYRRLRAAQHEPADARVLSPGCSPNPTPAGRGGPPAPFVASSGWLKTGPTT